jgi:hypothetical protein
VQGPFVFAGEIKVPAVIIASALVGGRAGLARFVCAGLAVADGVFECLQVLELPADRQGTGRDLSELLLADGHVRSQPAGIPLTKGIGGDGDKTLTVTTGGY